MKTTLRIAGWTLRASALICMVWIFAQVIGGRIDTLALLLSSVVWHAGFALSGVALVGAAGPARRSATEKAAGANAASPPEGAEERMAPVA